MGRRQLVRRPPGGLALALASALALMLPLALAHAPLRAQGPAPIVTVGAPACVSCDRPGASHLEPILAAHAEDPDRLFGAAVTFADRDRAIARGERARTPEGLENMTVDGFRSADGGRSWTRIAFPRCLVAVAVALSVRGPGRSQRRPRAGIAPASLFIPAPEVDSGEPVETMETV